MKFNKKILICALLVLMILCCVNAVSAVEPLNDTLKTSDDGVIALDDGSDDALSASGDTFVVDANGGGDYTSISSAVSAATGGETIFIKNGEYTETSKIDIGAKQLTFTGESQDGVIIKSGDNDLFYTTTSGYSSLVISGLTFKDISMTGARTPIFIGGDGNVTITDCTFDNCASRYGAIRIFTSGTVTIDNCKLLDTKSSTGSYSSAIDFGGSSSSEWTIKNTIIDGSSISSASTASYIFGAIYSEKTSGTVTLDNVTISNCNLTKSSGLISAKGNMDIKGSKIVNNYVYRDLAIAGLIFVNGAKTVTIESSLIANNTQPNHILTANSASATFDLNYNNIQNNAFNTAFTNAENGVYTLDANYWGSNDLPAGISATTWVVEENGEYKLNNGDALAKDIPGLTGGDEPGADYVYASPDGTGDGSSKDTPTTLENALGIVPEGGTIFLCNGEYTILDGIMIGKSVNFIGESRDGAIINAVNGAFLIANPAEPMDDTYFVDSVSFSKLTFTGQPPAFIQVPISMNELSITDCMMTSSNYFIAVGVNLLGEPSQTSGTLNFKKNILTANGAAILVAGSWNAVINDNLFITLDAGAEVIAALTGGVIDANYNYWGSSTPATPLEIDNWVIFDATADASEIYTDESAKIIMKATLNDGSDVSSHLPVYPIEVMLTADGNLSQTELALQNGFAQVTYTSNVVRNDRVRVYIIAEEFVIPITVKERYTGIIYVATTGSDDNEGSINAPVATVGKAIELANAGSHEIIINEGTYVGNGYHVTGDLTVTGNGKVTLDANNEGRFFYMEYGDTADKIELSNLILTNANGYGAAVYSFANELILDNVTIVNNAATGYLISSKGKLTIKDSEISKSMSGDVIQQTGNGDILINNTVFKDNSVADTTSVIAVINLNTASGNLVIENSKFINNTARQGVIKGNYNYNMDIKGTEFINNTNTVSYGGAIYTSGGNLNIADSVFINNKAARSGGAVYVGYRTTATIDKSVFINNSANTMNDEYYGDAIYDGNKLNVTNSILLTNSNNFLIYSDGEANVPYAQNNWWGTNDDPSSLNGVGYYEDDDWEEYDCPEVDVSNWVTMNASFAPEDAQAGDEVTVTAVFSNTNLPDGIEVTFGSTSGLNAVVPVVAGQASTTYTIDANDESITATSSNAVVEMPVGSPVATNIVTNDTFYNFFDESGMLLDTVTFDELIFQGEFSDLVDTIIITDEITLTGDNAVLNNIALSILGDDVAVTGFTLNENNANFTNNGGAAIYVKGSDVTLDNVSVTYNALAEVESKAIFANGAENFNLINSEIVFTGANPGSNHYRGLEVRNSNGAKIDNNTISAVLPAVAVDWAGTGIDQDLVLAVGIQGGNDVEFTNNVVAVNTNGAIGSYPTIDAVMVNGANDLLIKGNNITHIDTTTEDSPRYYYALDIYATTGAVEENNIIVDTSAGVDRAGTAYPIQLTGPFTVTIKGNNLTAISKGPIAGIYASNWAGAGTLTLENNNIDATGYATTGNYALVAGIEAEIDVLKAYNNTIVVKNTADYNDANQVIGVGIGASYFSGDPSADIKDNNITVDGKYAVYYAKAVNTNVTGNTLYGHDLEGDDAAVIEAGDNNVIKDNLPLKPYEGIIYVDAAGSDDNVGSIDAPVATIAKAVELALAGSGQIIVNEGTYDVPQVEITGDLDIAANGDVLFKAQDATKKAFWIKSGNVNISGITFTNFNATYAGSVIRLDAGSLAIDKSKFIKNGGENRQALIQVKGADLTLTNTVFEENTAHKTSTSYGNIYITNNGAAISTLYVDNCSFVNNYNKYGVFYITNSIATIYNSSFIGNNATSSSGGSGAGIYMGGTTTYGSYVLIQNCSFVNNTAKGNIGTYASYGGKGGALYVNNNATVIIKDSFFENNIAQTLTDDYKGQGGAIYASAGNIQIEKSIFKNDVAAEGSEIFMKYYTGNTNPGVNVLNITDSIILNDNVAIVADTTQGSYAANDNWWGTNDEPADKVANVTVESWAKMNASFAPADAYVGDEVTVTAVFDNPDLPDGIEVTFASTSGALDTVVATENAQASTTYTIVAGDEAITATSTDAVIEMPIVQPLANVTVTADPVWIGSNGAVSVSVPNATGTVTIEVNGKSYTVDLVDGVATKEIPADDLIAGENVITATYEGPEFATSNATAVLFVADGVVTQDTYLYYFNQADNGKFFDYIPEGATLDFQGSIINPDQAITVQMNVNKPVNIITTTNDAYVDLNTTAGSLLGESPGNSFAVTNGGSGSNVTGIYFHNTQVWIANTHNVVLDNISVVVEDQRVGSGVGATSIRQNSTNVVLKNSYLYTRNNGGSTTFTMSWATNCTIDNCTVKAEGNVGNLVYLNTFNVPGAPTGVPLNTYNKVINNKIYGKEGSGISVGLMVEGANNLIANNTLYRSSISTSFGGQNPANNTYVGNTMTDGSGLTALANSIVYGNNVSGALSTGANSVAYDNTVGGKMTVAAGATAYDNTVGNGLTTGGANAVIENNTITGAVTINKVGTTFVGNNVTGTVTVSANNNVIKENNITTTGNYAVDLGSKTGNNVTDNLLIASELKGDAAVKFTNADNVVENNYPVTSDLVISVEDVVYGEDAVVNVEFNPKATGTIVVSIDGTDYTVNITSEGQGSAIIPGLAANDYDVTATFTPDSAYSLDSDANASFTVFKANATMEAAADSVKVGDDVIVNVTFDKDDVTGTVSITVDGTDYTGAIEDGAATIVIPGLSAGEYAVDVIYAGDGNYNDTTASVSFAVDKYAVEFTKAKGHPGRVDQNATVEVILSESDATGTVSIIVNGTEYSAELVDGKAIIYAPLLPAGTYNFDVIYSGDDKYENNTAPITFNVNKYYPTMKATADDVQVDENANVHVVLPSDATGTVTITVDGVDYTADVVDGTATVELPVISEAGKQAFTVSYSGDDKYRPQTTTVKFDTLKYDATIKATARTVKLGNNVTVNVVLPSDATGEVSITINGTSYTGVAEDGAATIIIPDLGVGQYALPVDYAGDGKYNAANTTVTFNVNKQTTSIKATARTVKVGDDVTVNVALASDATGTVAIDINGTEYTAEVENGAAAIVIPGLPYGQYAFDVVYSGDDKYKARTTTVTFNVNKQSTTMKATARTVKVGDDVTVNVALASDVTGDVIITVDGVDYTATVVDGVATIVIPDLPAGQYALDVKYSGDDKYKNQSTTVKFNVNKYNVKMKVTAKYYVDGDYSIVSVTLSDDATGSVSVEVNGNNYTANVVDGSALVAISKLPAGDYPLNVVYSGDAKYKDYTVATTLKVVK